MSPERSRRTLGMCGRIGGGRNARVDTMSEELGGVRSLIDTPTGALRADAGAVRWPSSPRSAVSWSPAPMPSALPPSAAEVAEKHDAFSLIADDGAAPVLHSGISGAVPVYAELDGEPEGSVYFCSRIDPLVRTRDHSVRPDWHAWAHILATGGPLEGRTTFDGIHRLEPWTTVTLDPAGQSVLSRDGWPWLDVEISVTAGLDAVRDALTTAVSELAAHGELSTLLSGGWDSRILAVLGTHARRDGSAMPAWTTSSDTGTVMEELVAAKVAAHLGLRHEIVPPLRDDFVDDLDHFARAVDYQTSFHVWLVPVARALVGTSATVMDGLGGGLFVGGAFPDDDTDRPATEKRFDRLARYLHGAEEILHPHVVAQIRERTRESFERIATPLLDHPFAATFTAYLTRTVPGISLAPYGLVGAAAPVSTPFLASDVVCAALAIPPEQHADGRLYPELLRPIDPEMAELPTAADLVPPVRRHPRRVSSPEAAEHFRELLMREPVRDLLAPSLVAADISTWMEYLDNTRPQHLIRGVATLALWLERYADVLDDTGVDTLLEKA